ncbi:MAG: glycosyltransferase [Planctomycetota bacterium]|nr:glycosyltransferase [Planctomycetota bacterium]
MRILEVSTFYRQVGGAEIYMHQVAEGLRARGHEVAIFAGDPDESRDEELTRVVQRPDFHAGRLVRDPALNAAFEELCADFRPDLVHLHNTYSFPSEFPTVIAKAAAKSGAPICQTVHDWSLLCPNGWCTVPPSETEQFRVCEGGPGKKCLERGCGANYPFDGRVVLASVMKLASARAAVTNFTAPSSFLTGMLGEHGLGPAHALPLWIEPDSFGGLEAFEEAQRTVERDPNRMLFVGRIDREKGLDFLVRALPAILQRNPAARLELVGSGTETDNLRALAAELGVSDALVLHGRVPHDEVVGHLVGAAVHVFPSIWCENSPLTCYECLLAGTPMAASDIAGLPEMVREGETGILFRPRDVEHIAERMLELLGNVELQARLSAGCKQSVERYSRKAHLDRLEEVFAETRELGPKANPAAHDNDLLAALHSVLDQAKVVEDWANGMQGHLQHLEADRKAARGSLLGKLLGR